MTLQPIKTTKAIVAMALCGAATATPAGAQTRSPDEAAVRAAIDEGYRSYRTGEGGGFTLSPAFDRVWNRAVGKGGALDYDPFCSCQDFDPKKFRFRIIALKVAGSRATAEVDTAAFGTQWDHHRLTFVRTPQGWRLDDLGDRTDPSLKTSMARSRPGSWDVGAE